MSTLRKKYLSSEVGVLADSPKILHIFKEDFVQLNYLHSHQ